MTATAIQAVAALDLYDQEVKAAEAVVDGFLTGVDSFIKRADLDAAVADRLWSSLCDFAAERLQHQKSAEVGDGADTIEKPDRFGQALDWLRTTFVNPLKEQGGLGRVLGGGLMGAAGGLGYTMGTPSYGRSRPWLRNLLIGSLLGTVASPLWQRYGAPLFKTPAKA